MSTAKQINKLLEQLLEVQADKERQQIIKQLNELTNHGKQIRGVFDNPYYVNTLQRTS